MANALAQTRVLMRGRTAAEVKEALLAEGAPEEAASAQAPHRALPGNQPSSLLIYEQLDPRTLGALAALYEHKVFVESVLWQTNPFDQFGVEMGKKVAAEIRPAVSEALKPGSGRRGGLGDRAARLLKACPLGDE